MSYQNKVFTDHVIYTPSVQLITLKQVHSYVHCPTHVLETHKITYSSHQWQRDAWK